MDQLKFGRQANEERMRNIMNFSAKTASVEDDGYCTVVAFADDRAEPSAYAVLQVTNQPSQQDEKLGQTGVHVEIAGTGLVGYDLIEAIEMTDEHVALVFKDGAATGKCVERRIVLIDLSQLHTIEPRLRSAINMLQSRL